jgi:putative FmdB family regulatory protein
MPTYDYQCQACDHTFEMFQGINDPHLTKCPECGKPKLKRLMGIGAAVMFKGSGFYQTDYRSDSYKKRASEDKKSADNGAASDSSGASPSKSDSSGGKSESKTPKPSSDAS